MAEIKFTDDCKTVNDVIYMIALRARELANEKMPQLRLINAYGCDNDNQAREKDQGKSRGEIIEEILLEEFLLENHFDKEIEE